jgi:dihydrofolate reductase
MCWCIGGKKTYEKLCPLFDEIHISIINDETIGDTKAPELILKALLTVIFADVVISGSTPLLAMVKS